MLLKRVLAPKLRVLGDGLFCCILDITLIFSIIILIIIFITIAITKIMIIVVTRVSYYDIINNYYSYYY